MSNSFVAVANDVWAAYYNPAGLSNIENYQTGLSYQKLFSASFFTSVFASAVVPVSAEYGTVGIAVESFGVKYGGNTLNQEYVATFSHGFYLLNDIHTTLAIGYNIKYYQMSLGEISGFRPPFINGLILGCMFIILIHQPWALIRLLNCHDV